MTPRVIIAPTAEPISVQDVIDQGRRPPGEELALIARYISAARKACENYIRSTIAPTTLEIALPSFYEGYLRGRREQFYAIDGQQTYWGWQPTLSILGFPQSDSHSLIELEMGPVRSIVSIVYVDIDGATQTLDPSNYLLDQYREPNAVRLAYSGVWPAVRSQFDGVKIRYVAGYAYTNSPPEVVPPTIIQAILLTVDHFMENRTAVDVNVLAELPLGVKFLLDDERKQLGV